MDYLTLFKTCELTKDPSKLSILNIVCERAMNRQVLYQHVQMGVKSAYGIGVPWPVIAVIHFRETNQSFAHHLHNGDPLTARTLHVPKGRPVKGQPPFLWQESAVDAFGCVWLPGHWDLNSTLRFLELYNGTGYQRHGVNTPYLWDYTNQYTQGLYVGDGVFDPLKKEDRPGCVALLKTLEMKGVSLDFSSMGNAVGGQLH